MGDYKNSTLPVNERIKDLLSRMTLEEKIAQMDMGRGVDLVTKVHELHFCSVDKDSDFKWDKVRDIMGQKGIGFVHDIYSAPKVLNKLQKYFVEETRLGIPCIFTGEALHGTSCPGPSVFPMPIALGASFNPEIIRAVGHAIASETRCIGIHEILAPNLDLAREPRWGRMEETFGEDTYLSSQMAYAIIKGEQGDDVSAKDAVVCEPKHYCVHGIPEGGLNCSPARVGKREIETDFLPVFEAGIVKAGAYNAMASYNCIDGEAVICSEYYLRNVLKERFGLKGFVRSDFGAVNRLQHIHHMTSSNKESIQMAVSAGLDVQGFDFPNHVWQNLLFELVKEGGLSEKTIDESVERILRVKFDLGLFENPYTDEEEYQNIIRCAEHKRISYEAARQSIVMLQNNNRVLPISRDVSSIAVIGPSSKRQRIGSYSPIVDGYEVSSVYDEIKKAVSDKCAVYQAEGCSISEYDVDLIPKSWYMDGVKLEYFSNDHFEGEPVGTSEANHVNFNWILAKPHKDLEFNGYSVRMKARLKINTRDFVDEDRFIGKLAFTTHDSVRIKLNGEYVIESYGKSKQRLPQCEFEFINGMEYDLEIEYVCDVNGYDITLCVDYRKTDMETALDAAKKSDVVVMVCGDSKATSGESIDRCEIVLHGKQRELIGEISKLGKPVVLVLENGKAVDLSVERNHVDAILVAWFGGEFGAKAITDTLFGKANPAGRLPISFPKSVGQLPMYYSMLPGGMGAYLEGSREPEFPFGFGLSYTTFEYSNLRIEKGKKTYEYTVHADIKNTGEIDGDEVVQLYINDICSSVVTPLKLLKGFSRLSLKAGETKTVDFPLDFDSFKLLNVKFDWVVEPGDFHIMVGASCQDICLQQVITI